MNCILKAILCFLRYILRKNIASEILAINWLNIHIAWNPFRKETDFRKPYKEVNKTIRRKCRVRFNLTQPSWLSIFLKIIIRWSKKWKNSLNCSLTGYNHTAYKLIILHSARTFAINMRFNEHYRYIFIEKHRF